MSATPPAAPQGACASAQVCAPCVGAVRWLCACSRRVRDRRLRLSPSVSGNPKSRSTGLFKSSSARDRSLGTFHTLDGSNRAATRGSSRLDTSSIQQPPRGLRDARDGSQGFTFESTLRARRQAPSICSLARLANPRRAPALRTRHHEAGPPNLSSGNPRPPSGRRSRQRYPSKREGIRCARSAP